MLRREMAESARAHALTLRWETALEPLYRTYREVVRVAVGEAVSHASRTAPGNVAS
jgi:hypothetical protein